jgi:16S rRNA (cytosine967-C5)-methyltransferase
MLLKEAGIEAKPHAADPQRFLVLPRGCAVPALPGYGEGRFMVQDPATCLAVDLLDLQPGHNVLDACAAPGGKAVLAAERIGPTGRLVAMDLHEDRIALLRRNLERTGHPEVEIVRGNAARMPESAPESGPFDRILLDVPCTNTGVLRRRPDARWRFNPARLSALAGTQRRMLASVALRLAPRGVLVYSTCSLEKEENEDAVQSLLDSQPGFEFWAERRSIPPLAGMDGAYAAAIRRRA